jgi:hypothetical protein
MVIGDSCIFSGNDGVVLESGVVVTMYCYYIQR